VEKDLDRDGKHSDLINRWKRWPIGGIWNWDLGKNWDCKLV